MAANRISSLKPDCPDSPTKQSFSASNLVVESGHSFGKFAYPVNERFQGFRKPIVGLVEPKFYLPFKFDFEDDCSFAEAASR